MDEALRTVMGLEALDQSKETHKKVWRPYDDPFEDEPRKKQENSSRMVVKSVEASTEDAISPESSEVTVTQLREALASCMKEMEEVRKEFVAARGQPAQPNTTVLRPSRPTYSQSATGSTNNNCFRPRVPNGQMTNGYRGMGPWQPHYMPRAPGPCFTCGRLGHTAQYCRSSQAMATSTTVQQPPTSSDGPSKVQHAVNLKDLRDVYVPIQLFNRKTSVLLDTGCAISRKEISSQRSS